MRLSILLAVLSTLLLVGVTAGASMGQELPTSADFQPPDVACPPGQLPEPPPLTGDAPATTCSPVADLRGSPLTGGTTDTSPPGGHFAQAGAASNDPIPNPGDFIVATQYKENVLPATYSSTFATYLEVYPWYVPEEFNGYTGGMYLTAVNRVDHGGEFVATYYNSSHDFSPMYPAGIIQFFDWSCSPEYPCYNEAGEIRAGGSFVWDAWLPDVPCWYKMLEDNTGHYVNYLYYRNSTFNIGGDMWRNAVSIWNYCDSVYDGVYTHDFVPAVQNDCNLPEFPCGGYAGSIELFDFNQPPEVAKQGFHHQALYHDGQVSALGPDAADFVNNSLSLWQQYYLHPNNLWEVGTYQDDDGDDFPNSSVPGNQKPADPDIDGDGGPNVTEVICGAIPPAGKTAAWDPYVSEERIDGQFAGVDDDGDTQIDEALPIGAGSFECDGDGWIGEREAGKPLCGNGLNDDRIISGGGSDDSVIDDGCPGGPPQTGYYSEGSFNIGTVDQDPCGSNRWPADLSPTGSSYNRITLADITSFNVPTPAKFGTSPGDAGFNPRWDLLPGPGSGSNPWIQLSDMTSITGGGPTTYPPMLNGVKAFGGPPCPWPP